MEFIEQALATFSRFMWGMPLVVLLIGGGLYFMIYSRFTPFRYFGHAIDVLKGKYDNPDDPGDITHFQALMSALASTIGMGNISGVAIAIVIGGPGALFWMWVSAFVGMATKFFTCTLAILYRGKDSAGDIQGGPMYWIVEGLGKKWKWLAMIFAFGGIFGPLPIFQANQLVQTIREVILEPRGMVPEDPFLLNLSIGFILVIVVSMVIFGGIKRIGQVAARLVPAMVILYFISVLMIIFIYIESIPSIFAMIFSDAFTGDALLGGSIGAIILIGVQRAAFSNEAGIGTAPLAHGAAKTKEPIREGLVAMMGPAIDTLVVCTLTAFAILTTGVWETTESNGITVTAQAFSTAMPTIGIWLLVASIFVFSISSLFTYSYYGTKCLGFLIGAERQHYYNYIYVATIIFGAVASIEAVVNLIDGMFAVMAFPTMTSALLLSPKVRAAAKDYFSRMSEFISH